MRIVEAGKSALSAELELVKHRAVRIGRQAALLIFGLVLGFFSLITGHALLWAIFLFKFHFGPVGAPAAVFGCDIFFALLFLFMGRRSYIRPAEVEAWMTRDRNMNELRQAATFAAFTGVAAGPILRMIVGLVRGRSRK